MAITLTQIATWLDEAVQAKHDLVTGQAIVRVNGPSAQVEFYHATDAGAIGRLDALISSYRAMLAQGTTDAPAVRPIYFGF